MSSRQTSRSVSDWHDRFPSLGDGLLPTHCRPWRAFYYLPMGRRGAMHWLLACGLVGACLVFVNPRPVEGPSPALADEIDRLLTQDPCVGSIENWTSREYTWRRNSQTWGPLGRWFGSDKSVVQFALFQRGSPEAFPPGRHLRRAGEVGVTFSSDPDLLLVFGEYDVEAGRLTEFHCGSNY